MREIKACKVNKKKKKKKGMDGVYLSGPRPELPRSTVWATAQTTTRRQVFCLFFFLLVKTVRHQTRPYL
jgi:hypothetical protein